MGISAGDRIWLSAAESMLGRDENASLRFTDRGVSRRHAKFMRASDGIVSLLDLGSTNGTFVNGNRVEVTVLREGDRIQLGSHLVVQFSYEVPNPPGPKVPLPLSERQIEVARQVASGLTSAEIAEKLGISTRTVTSHLDHIYDRLGISSRAALTRLIVEAGLLKPEK